VATFVNLLVGGLLSGGIYALVALGLAIVFGVSRILNVAHGDFVMLGAFCAFFLSTTLGVGPVYAIPIVSVVVGLGGVLLERIAARPFLRSGHRELLVGPLLVTLGVSLVLAELVTLRFDAIDRSVRTAAGAVRAGPVAISTTRLAALVAMALLTVALTLFITRTFPGRALRALAQDPEGARLVGVDVGAATRTAFGVSAGVAGIAGTFYVVLFTANPHMGLPLTLKSLAVIVLGGLGSLPGAFAAGLLLGVAEAMTSYYVGGQWTGAVAVIALIGVLVVRPQGLFVRG
jgi:branched-chain amino acid transport system permease protein